MLLCWTIIHRQDGWIDFSFNLLWVGPAINSLFNLSSTLYYKNDRHQQIYSHRSLVSRCLLLTTDSMRVNHGTNLPSCLVPQAGESNLHPASPSVLWLSIKANRSCFLPSVAYIQLAITHTSTDMSVLCDWHVCGCLCLIYGYGSYDNFVWTINKGVCSG